MCTVVNVITDTVLILLADFRHVGPHSIEIVKEFAAVVSLVFLTT